MLLLLMKYLQGNTLHSGTSRKTRKLLATTRNPVRSKDSTQSVGQEEEDGRWFDFQGGFLAGSAQAYLYLLSLCCLSFASPKDLGCCQRAGLSGFSLKRFLHINI